MGMIQINFKGSFGMDERIFMAITHGHAHAVNEAIKYLSDKMRNAINLDHHLRGEGVKPEKGFRKEEG